MPGTTHFSIEGNFINVVSNGGYLDGGMDQRSFDPSAATPPEKNQESNPIETLGVCGSPTLRTWWQAEQSIKAITQVLVHSISGINTTVVYLLST